MRKVNFVKWNREENFHMHSRNWFSVHEFERISRSTYIPTSSFSEYNPFFLSFFAYETHRCWFVKHHRKTAIKSKDFPYPLCTFTTPSDTLSTPCCFMFWPILLKDGLAFSIKNDSKLLLATVANVNPGGGLSNWKKRERNSFSTSTNVYCNCSCLWRNV